MWWLIIKSSRNEAYAKFLEEFGPGFEIWRLDRHGIEFRGRELIGDDWIIHMDNMGDITIHSEKYRPYLAFVEGMFKQEYPERYKEIGDLLIQLILKNKDESTQDDLRILIDKYYLVFEDVMRFLRVRIENYFDPISDYNREAGPLMLSATNPLYLNESKDSKKIAQRVNNKSQVGIVEIRSGKRSLIIYHIIAHMLDRMIADVNFLRDQNNASRVGRLTLIQRYYNFFMKATNQSPEDDPGMEVNLKVGDAADRLIIYLNGIVKEYLGVE